MKFAEEYITYKPITGVDEETNEFFQQMCEEVNQAYTKYSEDKLFRKTFELYGNSWQDYFELLTQNGQQFIDKSLPFFVYSTCYVAIQRKYFGVFNSFFRIFNNILADNDYKKIVLSKFANLYISQLKNLNEEELLQYITDEFNLFDDAVNIITILYESFAMKIKSVNLLIKFTQMIFEKENLSMTEKAVCLRLTQIAITNSKYNEKVLLTLNYGVDENDNKVCHYKDLDIQTIPFYETFAFDMLYHHLDTLTELQKTTVSSFFLLDYTYHLNNFYIKPFVRQTYDDLDEEDKVQNRLFVNCHKYLLHLFHSIMPKVFPNDYDYVLSEELQETIKNDLDLFIEDGSVHIYEDDFTLEEFNRKKLEKENIIPKDEEVKSEELK